MPTAALKCSKGAARDGTAVAAVAVLEQATIAHPGNKRLLAAYGRALADNGNFQQAFDELGRAHSHDDPDWRLLSAQGDAGSTRPIRGGAAILCRAR